MSKKKIGVCFGHRDAPDTLRPRIEAAILRLVGEGVSCFYVGNHGRFDRMVMQTLKQLSASYALPYFALRISHSSFLIFKVRTEPKEMRNDE